MLNTEQKQGILARKFGVLMGIILCVIGILKFHIYDKKIIALVLSLSLCIFIISFYKPTLLIPLYRGWIKFGVIISLIVQPFIMFIIFFFLFVPLGVFFRITKQDPLKLKFSSQLSTYWHNKEFFNKENMKQQF